MVRRINAKPKRWLYRARPLYIGKIVDVPVSVIWAAPGAPLATLVMEDLIACGAKVFIAVGLSGAIQPNIEVGDLLIPLEAIRDEGTSYHSIPKDVRAVPAKSVLEALERACRTFRVKYHIGSVWTTDAPYRETKSKIRRFQAKGILGVDMETSAVYSLAIYRKVRAGCVLITSDNLVTLTSTRGLETLRLKQAVEKAVEIAVETIKILS